VTELSEPLEVVMSLLFLLAAGGTLHRSRLQHGAVHPACLI